MSKVYILMATYNGEKYLREQLDSLFNQTYQEWVLWIHDDNSTDSTELIINEYVDRYPDKIIHLNDGIRCGGAKENFSYLLEKIDDNYDYVMFCDQDDVWLDTKIDKFIKTVKDIEKSSKNKQPICIFSDLVLVDEKLNILSPSMVRTQRLNPIIASSFDYLKCQNVVTGCAMMLNKLAIQNSLPIPDSALMHDWWIALKVSINGQNIFINESLVLYRQHESNVVGAKEIKLCYIVKKIFSLEFYTSFVKVKLMLNEIGIKIGLLQLFVCKLKTARLRFLSYE